MCRCDNKVLVYRTKDGFVRVDAGATSAPKAEELADARVDLSGWSIRINPRDEWKQILREAWRLQRDFFYDPNMHGVDWQGVWNQYGSLSDRIASRDDVEDLLGEMFGELNVGPRLPWRRRSPAGQAGRHRSSGGGPVVRSLQRILADQEDLHGRLSGSEGVVATCASGPEGGAGNVAGGDRRPSASEGGGLPAPPREPRGSGGRAVGQRQPAARRGAADCGEDRRQRHADPLRRLDPRAARVRQSRKQRSDRVPPSVRHEFDSA